MSSSLFIGPDAVRWVQQCCRGYASLSRLHKMSNTRLFRKALLIAKEGFVQISALPQVAQDVGSELATAFGLPGSVPPSLNGVANQWSQPHPRTRVQHNEVHQHMHTQGLPMGAFQQLVVRPWPPRPLALPQPCHTQQLWPATVTSSPAATVPQQNALAPQGSQLGPQPSAPTATAALRKQDHEVGPAIARETAVPAAVAMQTQPQQCAEPGVQKAPSYVLQTDVTMSDLPAHQHALQPQSHKPQQSTTAAVAPPHRKEAITNTTVCGKEQAQPGRQAGISIQSRSAAPRRGAAQGGSMQLNRRIMAAGSTGELLALVRSRGPQLDYFNISSAIARVPKLAALSASARGLSTHAAVAVAAAVQPRCDLQRGSNSGSSTAHRNDSLRGATLDAAGRALADELAVLVCQHIGSFDARGLANSAWAFGKLATQCYAPSPALPALIAAAALPRLSEFTPQHLANLSWSLAHLRHHDEPLLRAVAAQLALRAPEFGPQELANTLWALATLESDTSADDAPDTCSLGCSAQAADATQRSAFLSAASSRAMQLAPQFKEQELAITLWSFARLRHYDGVLFSTLAGQGRQRLGQLLPQAISNIAWALATAGHRDEELLTAVAAHCTPQRLIKFDVQAIANIAWAMAIQGVHHQGFLKAAAQQCFADSARMSAQHLSMVLWSCATLGHHDAGMRDTWAQLILARVHEFGPQALSNAAWSFSRLGLHNARVYDALAAAAMPQLHQFTGQGLSMTAGAFATAQHMHAPLFDGIAAQVIRQTSMPGSSAWAVQHCSVLAWAFATARHAAPNMFDVIVGHVSSAAASSSSLLESQNLANTLWACARMGYHLTPYQGAALVHGVHQLLPSMAQQDLCNSIWALAALQLLDTRTFGMFCERLPVVEGLTSEGIHQAYHAQLMLHSTLQRAHSSSTQPATIRAPLPLLPEPLLSMAHEQWSVSACDVTMSRLQRDVSACLHNAGVPNVLEWLTDDGLLSIDVALQINQWPIAVEVDGPHHYSSNLPHVPLNDVVVRRRLLEDRGWQVINLGFMEWKALGRSSYHQAQGVLSRIAQAIGTTEWLSVSLPVRCTVQFPGFMQRGARGQTTDPTGTWHWVAQQQAGDMGRAQSNSRGSLSTYMAIDNSTHESTVEDDEATSSSNGVLVAYG